MCIFTDYENNFFFAAFWGHSFGLPSGSHLGGPSVLFGGSLDPPNLHQKRVIQRKTIYEFFNEYGFYTYMSFLALSFLCSTFLRGSRKV